MLRYRVTKANLDAMEKELMEKGYRVERREELDLDYWGRVKRYVNIDIESENLRGRLDPFEALIYLRKSEIAQQDERLLRWVKNKYKLPFSRETILLWFLLPVPIILTFYLLL